MGTKTRSDHMVLHMFLHQQHTFKIKDFLRISLFLDFSAHSRALTTIDTLN